jgi:signal transduction histidine kinase
MSIQGYAEAIESGIAEDPKEAAAVIRKESIRLTALVGELLTLSRLDADGYEVRRGSVDLNEFLAENVYRLEGLAIREHKKLVLNQGPEGLFAAADEQLLSQAIANTVSNCLRYASAGVELSLARKDAQAVITVADDGPGFEEAALPRLFDRFYKGKGGNFGLGLAIAKKSMELMGGSITARNGERGATFELTLAVEPPG